MLPYLSEKIINIPEYEFTLKDQFKSDSKVDLNEKQESNLTF